MKHTLTLALMLVFSATTLFAQHTMNDKDRKSPHETITKKHITITYGRPYKKGRDIFGALVPYGKVWRTGADEATEITIDRDCMFAGQKLKAGTYTMFTIPEQNEWEIILNSELALWGAFTYDKIKDKNVLDVKVPVKKTKKVAENFTIRLKKKGFSMEWDRTKVEVPVKF